MRGPSATCSQCINMCDSYSTYEYYSAVDSCVRPEQLHPNSMGSRAEAAQGARQLRVAADYMPPPLPARSQVHAHRVGSEEL